MLGNNFFESPWQDTFNEDFWMNIILCLIVLVIIAYFAILHFKKININKLDNIIVPIVTGIFNCLPVILFKWLFAIPIIIIQTIIMWLAYSATITTHARFQFKNIKSINKLETEDLESEYDLSHTKEELECIERKAKQYPRVGLLKFSTISIMLAVIFFGFLLLIGSKYNINISL